MKIEMDEKLCLVIIPETKFEEQFIIKSFGNTDVDIYANKKIIVDSISVIPQ